MKNTCAQSGKCEYCGESIIRYTPKSVWISTQKKLFWELYECSSNDGGVHKLAPIGGKI